MQPNRSPPFRATVCSIVKPLAPATLFVSKKRCFFPMYSAVSTQSTWEQQMAEIQNKREAYMRAMRERNLSKKNDNVAQSPTNSMTLTVEQKQQIEENRRRAMEKRSATVTAEQQQQIEENRRKAIEKRLERVNLGNSMEE
eukprot:Selendium_serpulae@DN6298_c0_g1_i1.p4